MNIIKKDNAIVREKAEGTTVSYYLFPEYEVAHGVLPPGTLQTWHHHEELWETVYITEGEMTALWKDGDTVREQVVRPGDLIETERTPHTFKNHTKEDAKFVVFKFMPTGEDSSERRKNDKVIDE